MSSADSYRGRPENGYRAPPGLAAEVLPTALLEGLGLELLDPDDVVLSPRLLRGCA